MTTSVKKEWMSKFFSPMRLNIMANHEVSVPGKIIANLVLPINFSQLSQHLIYAIFYWLISITMERVVKVLFLINRGVFFVKLFLSPFWVWIKNLNLFPELLHEGKFIALLAFLSLFFCLICLPFLILLYFSF